MQDNEDDPKQKQKDTHAEDVPIVADRLDRAPAKPVGEDQSADNPEKHKWADKWMVRLTAGLVLLAAVSAVVGYLQWTSINGQLEEMRSSGSQTERQIILAMGQLAVANRTTSSAGVQADSSQKNVKAIQQQMRIDQRAWISLGSVNSRPLTVGEIFKVTLAIRNEGKTPATHTRMGIYFEHRKKGEKPRLEKDAQIAWPSGTILPNTQIYNSPTLTMCVRENNTGVAPDTFPCPLTQGAYDEAMNGSEIIYVHGRTTYFDVFDHPHWFTFCYFLGTDKILGTDNIWIECPPTRTTNRQR